MSYVSKYIAKVTRKVRKTFFIYAPYLHGRPKWKKGRFWGYHNKKLLPLGQKITGVLTNSETIKRLSKAAWNIIGHANRFGSVSFHLFTDHATSLAMRNIEQGGLYSDEWTWSRQLTHREHNSILFIQKRFSEADFEKDKQRAQVYASRPRSAGTVQPCTRTWVAVKSVFCPLRP